MIVFTIFSQVSHFFLVKRWQGFFVCVQSHWKFHVSLPNDYAQAFYSLTKKGFNDLPDLLN